MKNKLAVVGVLLCFAGSLVGFKSIHNTDYGIHKINKAECVTFEDKCILSVDIVKEVRPEVTEEETVVDVAQVDNVPDVMQGNEEQTVEETQAETYEETTAQVETEPETYAQEPVTDAIADVASANAASNGTYETDVITGTNQIRVELGLSTLSNDSMLEFIANYRCAEMAATGVFSHTRPDNSNWYTLLSQYGYSYGVAAENIYMTSWSSYGVEAVDAWKNSESHYSNIINGDITKIGVGRAVASDGTVYWAQIFSN